MNMNKLRRDLAAIFRRHLVIRSAYLFGSTAQGADRQLSDVDIAIRLTDNILPEASFHIRMQLMDDLEDYFGQKVDIIVLNSASLKLIHQAIRGRKIVFERDPREELDYVIQKQKEYFDFRYYIDREIQALRRYFEGKEV